MPRQKISAKYTGEAGEHYMGVPARDLTEDEFDALSDDQKATLAASSFYSLRHGATEEAEQAAKRVEKADPEPTVLEAQAVANMLAPKDGAKEGGKK